MPDRDYRKDFKFIGGTPGKGTGSLWQCCWCKRVVCASLGHAAKHYIKEIRCQTMLTQARQLSEEAQGEMKAATGDPSFKGRKKFLEASDKFDRAMKLYDEADALPKEKST